jgi:hypothetical protein
MVGTTVTAAQPLHIQTVGDREQLVPVAYAKRWFTAGDRCGCDVRSERVVTRVASTVRQDDAGAASDLKRCSFSRDGSDGQLASLELAHHGCLAAEVHDDDTISATVVLLVERWSR